MWGGTNKAMVCCALQHLMCVIRGLEGLPSGRAVERCLPIDWAGRWACSWASAQLRRCVDEGVVGWALSVLSGRFVVSDS